METSYPIFESGQVLTHQHLNDVVRYLEEQERLSRIRLVGIGIVCGLEISSNPAGNQVRLTGGCAVTSKGYLVVMEDTTAFNRFRPYTLPEAELEQAPEMLVIEPKYSFFLNAQGNQIPLWELIPVAYQPGPGEQLSPIANAFLQDKVALIFLEGNLESLRNCDTSDCDDQGAELEFTRRVLLANRADAANMIAMEAQFSDAPTDRNRHPIYDLNEFRIEKLNPAGVVLENSAPFDSYGDLFMRVLGIAQRMLPALWGQMGSAYQALRYVLDEVYPPAQFPNGPFSVPGYPERLMVQLEKNFHLAQYAYAYLNDLALAHNEFLRLAIRLEAECCPDERRFPQHVLIGRVQPRRVAQAIPLENPQALLAFEPLRANDGPVPPRKPLAFRHHFVPSPLFDRQNELVRQVRSLHYRLYLLAYRFTLDDLSAAGIRITPSRKDAAALSERAIPFYYALGEEKVSDDLAANWSYSKLVENRVEQIFSHRYIPTKLERHPLRSRLDEADFYRVEGCAGKPLGQVMQALLLQKRRLGLPFTIQPVYFGASPNQNRGDFAAQEQRAQQLAAAAMARLIYCQVDNLDANYLALTEALKKQLLGLLAILAKIKPESIVAPPAGGGAAGGLGGLVVTRPGKLGKPELSIEATKFFQENQGVAYKKGTFTSTLVSREDPKTSLGGMYARVVTSRVVGSRRPTDLFDRTNVVIGELFPGFNDDARRIVYLYLSLIDKTEEVLAILSPNTLADFDYARFEAGFSAFALAFDAFMDQAAKEKVNPESDIAKALKLLQALYDSIAADNYSVRYDALVKELRRRLGPVFDDLTLGRYALINPGLEHSGGVPAGGTLVLLYTLGEIFLRSLDGFRNTFDEAVVQTRRGLNLGQSPGRLEIPAVVTTPPATAVRTTLDQFIVLADLYLPYLCCGAQCTEVEIARVLGTPR